MIELIAASKQYAIGSRAVHALLPTTLSIAEGEMVAVTGASGSGKSTLMHLLGCLDRPSSGEYFLRRYPVAGMSDAALAVLRNRHIGFVFQAFCLMPRLTALENVMHPLDYRGVGRPERVHRARTLLARVGMEAWCDHLPRELSGGQQQRVAIARALVGDPCVLLADEPTGNLDSASAACILSLLRELHEEGRTVMLVTHDTSVAAACARRIVLRDGAVVEDREVSICVQ